MKCHRGPFHGKRTVLTTERIQPFTLEATLFKAPSILPAAICGQACPDGDHGHMLYPKQLGQLAAAAWELRIVLAASIALMATRVPEQAVATVQLLSPCSL